MMIEGLIGGVLLGAAVAGLVWRVWLRVRRRRALAMMIREMEALTAPVLMVEYPSDLVHLSPVLRQELGLEAGEVLRVDEAVERFVQESDWEHHRKRFRDVRDGRHAYLESELTVRFNDGRWHQLQAQIFRVGPCGGRAEMVVANLVDLTRHREIEEERDRLFNLSLDLLAVGDFEGRLLQVNPAWVRVLRWSRDDIMERSWTTLIHPDDREQAEAALAELGEGIPIRDLELRTLCRDNSFRWIAWSSFPLLSRGTVFTVAHDVTDRKAADEELARYQQRLRQLASQLSKVEERENRRLAEILHDTLAQDLFAAGAKLALMKYPDRLENPDTIRKEAEDIISHATELTRTLTFELFPPALYEVGLDAALEWLCRSFRKTRGLECTFLCEGETLDLVQDMRTLLYQGARELLGNVYKHAGARRAEVRLEFREVEIVLEVDDDGCGFDLDDLGVSQLDDEKRGGFGLFNIRERLGQLSGELSIGTSPLGGGRVTITVPVGETRD